MRLMIFILIFVFGAAPPEAFAEKNLCVEQLSSVNVNDGTENFIAYMAMLLEENIIGEVELQRAAEGHSVITERETQISSAKLIHRAELERQLRENNIDLKKLKSWALSQLKNHNVDKVERQETRAKTEIPFRLPKFHEIPPGKFIMGEDFEDPDRHVEVEITKSFQMSDVPVTQWLYAVVMGYNPSTYTKGPLAITADIDGNHIAMRPDNPVEKVSWDDVTLFLEQLNKLSQENDPKIYFIFPDHVKGAIYARPTEAQWEYVTRNLGEANGRFGAARSEGNLMQYAWFNENSEETTHPVAEKTPMIVNGHTFYDLLGNVSEWCEDAWDADAALIGGKDPIGTNGDLRTVRGGSYYNFTEGLRAYKRDQDQPSFADSGNGIRLVRHLP